MKYNNEKDRGNRICMWHAFEQFEALVFDVSNSLEVRKDSFVALTNCVDTMEILNICTEVDREWMFERIEEIATLFPELIS